MLFRNVVVAELRIEQVTGRQQGTEAGIPGIFGITQIVTDRTPGLSGFIIASKGRAGGHADCAVKFYTLFHQNIQNSRCKNAADASAFKNQSCLHCVYLPPDRIF